MHYFQEWIALLYGCYAVIIAYLNKNIKISNYRYNQYNQNKLQLLQKPYYFSIFI